MQGMVKNPSKAKTAVRFVLAFRWVPGRKVGCGKTAALFAAYLPERLKFMQEANKQSLQSDSKVLGNEKQKKELCQNCGHYTMVKNRKRFLMLGWLGLAFTFLFLFLVITIPLAPVAFVACLIGFIGAIFAKGGSCSNCHFKLGQ